LEPEIYGLFPCAKELIKSKIENPDGVFSEYSPWIDIYRADAIIATEDEHNDLIRGGKVTMHILSNIPVVINKWDKFATYGLIPYKMDDVKAANSKVQNMPQIQASFAHIALNYRTLIDKGIKGLLSEVDNKIIEIERDLKTSRIAENEVTNRKFDFYESVKLSLNAVLTYAERYKLEAIKQATSEQDKTRKQELNRLAQTLEKVPYLPAGSFL